MSPNLHHLGAFAIKVKSFGLVLCLKHQVDNDSNLKFAKTMKLNHATRGFTNVGSYSTLFISSSST
jgi:hypothetical protein